MEPSWWQTASNYGAGASAIGTISSVFAGYEAGKMQELAYQNDAAMAELNARQIGINAQFIMADKYTELTNVLAMQSVMAVASGRSGGSVDAIRNTSIERLKKEEKRIRLTGNAQATVERGNASSSRAAANYQNSVSLLTAVGNTATGIQRTASFLV